MEGEFLRKKFNIWLFLLFLCGVCFIGMYVFLNIVDPQATSELLSFLVIGILLCVIVIPCGLMNAGAYIRIEGNSICAKYHWFGRVKCEISNVVFATSRINTLVIQLADGKTHTIMGVANARELCCAIRREMPFEAAEQPDILIRKRNEFKSSKKSSMLYVCVGLAFMFINIFLTVFLTGERDLHEFSENDWIIMAIMGAIEIATVIATFWFAHKTGAYQTPIEKAEYDIRRTVVETKPLLPGYIVAVYADIDCYARVTVFGYPHRDEVYYAIQQMDGDFNLVQVYTSDTYEDVTELSDDVLSLENITEKVIQE